MISDENGAAPDPTEPVLHYIHSLPVTTEEALALGRDVWEFPKAIGRITLAVGDDLRTTIELPNHYRLAVEARLSQRHSGARRIRLRPLLAGDTLNLAHVAIEASSVTEIDAEGLSLEASVFGDEELAQGLRDTVFIEGYVINSASALLSAPLESFTR
jgi:hypothetical protein